MATDARYHGLGLYGVNAPFRIRSDAPDAGKTASPSTPYIFLFTGISSGVILIMRNLRHAGPRRPNAFEADHSAREPCTLLICERPVAMPASTGQARLRLAPQRIENARNPGCEWQALRPPHPSERDEESESAPAGPHYVRAGLISARPGNGRGGATRRPSSSTQTPCTQTQSIPSGRTSGFR